MPFLQFILCFLMSILLSTSTLKAQNSETNYDVKAVVASTITVDQSGGGNFTTVQQAINSIPSNNKVWTLVHLKAGVYKEKVLIPQDKSFILLEGENKATTVIQWGDAGGLVLECSTFTSLAANFIATNITFKNTYNRMLEPSRNGRKVTWAPAALIRGDKSSFYNCAFISLQDTLTDSDGRHFFQSCYIEGAMDFIWGNGQSIYQTCVINVTTSSLGGSSGFITAQARNTTHDNTGYVFKQCLIMGTGPAYLGRAYGKYSRVLFYKSVLTNIIAPEGWSSWHYNGSDGLITYAEVGCTGAGSGMSKRVKWEKNLSVQDWKLLTNPATFINQEGWLQKQPHNHNPLMSNSMQS